ncbi:carotenoid 1,2-hydratase [Hydrogenophaga sp.]|uniref:carotenoid 1,2-hydratase n=1 Tax=Hydrogenophaga sp. TaxID=1904254 RepID=UPI0026098FCE|nr:carotenoid 1,2-hydratase [Hydrogenophaga sp.]MDM7949870.1 carotenoid 1,2-hydratase [Hydrogenophaga sp.]
MPSGGYLWWYIDALSDDGTHGLSLIAFVGSVFSPYYAWARRGGAATRPDNHCALNVALYSRHARRWSMTERGERHNHRERALFTIGPSQLHWNGSSLDIHIDEVGAPIPRRIKGRIRLFPEQLFGFSTALDTNGRHRWGPLAPQARVEVELQHPAQRWSGSAYLDSNEGDEPVERAFTEWDWSRARLADGSTAVLYDVEPEQDHGRLLALRFQRDGQVTPFEAPPQHALPRTAWRIARRQRSDSPPQIIEQLEDTPFYQRAMLRQQLLGETVTSFHETLHVPRLVSPVVQAMLPWRMPRRG